MEGERGQNCVWAEWNTWTSPQQRLKRYIGWENFSSWRDQIAELYLPQTADSGPGRAIISSLPWARRKRDEKEQQGGEKDVISFQHGIVEFAIRCYKDNRGVFLCTCWIVESVNPKAAVHHVGD